MPTKAIPLDTLLYAKKLKQAGFTEAQAEVQAEALADLVNIELATKRDLKELESRIVVKLGAMVVALGGFLAAVKFFG